jgi:hypothetical protein
MGHQISGSGLLYGKNEDRDEYQCSKLHADTVMPSGSCLLKKAVRL